MWKGIGMDWVLSGCEVWLSIRKKWNGICILTWIWRWILSIYRTLVCLFFKFWLICYGYLMKYNTYLKVHSKD